MKNRLENILILSLCLVPLHTVASGFASTLAIEAARIEKPPAIDGRLNDSSWQVAKPVSGFNLLHSQRTAEHQTVCYVGYDEENLYVGMKCLKPTGAIPHGEQRTREGYFFADDLVEILLDPGATGNRYYQFVVNAYGSIWESARSAQGAVHDPRWQADWKAASHIGDDYWSMEAAIPFHVFEAVSGFGNEWGINLCRASHTPTPYTNSTIASNGVFHNARAFPRLTGFTGDLSKYSIAVRDAQPRYKPSQNSLAALVLPIRNISDEPRKVQIRQFSEHGDRSIKSIARTLSPREITEIDLGSLQTEPLLEGRRDAYLIVSSPNVKRVVVADSDTGAILASRTVGEPRYMEVLNLEVSDPWQAGVAMQHTSDLSLRTSLNIDQELLKGSELKIKLLEHSRDAKDSERVIFERRFTSPSDTIRSTFVTEHLPWGSYVVCAELFDRSGELLTSARASANVLPGPPSHVVVLNNLVTELMDVKHRGLLSEKQVEIMNPRDGWIWLQLSGSGSAKIKGRRIPFDDGEAMLYLPAGRHSVDFHGEVKQFIARAVPELIYAQYPTGPGVDGYDVQLYTGTNSPPSSWTTGVELGKYDWEFLYKHVLNNCNVIVGDTDESQHLEGWVESGRKWLSTTGGPGYHMFYPAPGQLLTAAECAEYWAQGPGYTHPLTSGAFADDCSNASEPQFLEWARAVRILGETSEFQDRTFYPWTCSAFGSDGNLAFLRTVVELGGKYAFYKYLPEQSSQEEAERLIEREFSQAARSFNERSWQSVRNMIAAPGIMSHPPLSQNVNPAVDFKTHMELQMHALANENDFFGLHGLMWYYSAYADEENTRWAGRLFRHYCIDGNTDRLTIAPYQVKHLVNPDFESGTQGWSVTQATADTVRVDNMSGYGAALETRYLGGSRGDTFLVMKRSVQRPNTVSQILTSLDPSRLYSVKMISANLDNIRAGRSENKPDTVRILLDGAKIIPGHRRNYWFTSPHNYGLSYGKFTAKNRGYVNYHWYVFRPEHSEVTLTISDWESDEAPGGPIGEQTMINFIEVQSYFEGGDN